MSKKDYKILAKAMAEAYDTYNYPMAHDMRKGIDAATEKLCDALLVDNAKFNKSKFLAAITTYQCKVTV